MMEGLKARTGTVFIPYACDVTNQTEIEELVSRKYLIGVPPIEGVIHGVSVNEVSQYYRTH